MRKKTATNRGGMMRQILMSLPEKQVGIRQQVYLPVHRILRYGRSLYAKYASGQACLYLIKIRPQIGDPFQAIVSEFYGS